jgi:hypothetical protein
MKSPWKVTMRDHENAPRVAVTPATWREDARNRSCLALVCELEESLRLSQSALLALDAAGTERWTREQIRLWRALRAILPVPVSPVLVSAAGEFRREIPPCLPELAAQLHAAAIRVQQLARVQAALLRRSQQFLCVLANWMAGPQMPYGPPGDASGGGSGAPAETHEGF